MCRQKPLLKVLNKAVSNGKRRRPSAIVAERPNLNLGAVPFPADVESNGSIEFFRPPAGKNLKCELVYAKGKRISIDVGRVRRIVIEYE